MKFFNLLEEKFNKFAIGLAIWFHSFLLKVIPGYYQRKYERLKGSMEEATMSVYQKALLIAVEQKQKTETSAAWWTRKIVRIKEKFTEIFHHIKNINFHHLKNPKKFLAFTYQRISPALLKIKNISPQRIAGAIILSLFTGLSLFGVFSQGNRILEKAGHGRKPANAEEMQLERKSYHKEEQRQLTLTNLTIPVHFVDINQIRKTDIEFSITTSNRYTKQFLEKFEYKLIDHLFMTVEPIVPSFPLQEEGKDIIKEKIKSETNEFLKNYHIDGYIQDIEITYILSV